MAIRKKEEGRRKKEEGRVKNGRGTHYFFPKPNSKFSWYEISFRFEFTPSSFFLLLPSLFPLNTDYQHS
jgi:hypothetical protein